jgi:hypothetical protein
MRVLTGSMGSETASNDEYLSPLANPALFSNLAVDGKGDLLEYKRCAFSGLELNGCLDWVE